MPTQDTHFDLCIIGAGPAGYSAAIRALDYNIKICLIERRSIGGAGLYWGALVSKSLWELSDDYAKAKRTDRGYLAHNLKVSFASVLQTALNAAREKEDQMFKTLDHFKDKHKDQGTITFIKGDATFLDSQTVKVTSNSSEFLIKAKEYVVATGSKPRSFEHITTDQSKILDTDGILNLKKFPKKLLIVGAGIIGCEYATIFSNFGQTEIHLLDHADGILPFEDPDIARHISNNLVNNGVKIHHRARLISTEQDEHFILATIQYGDGHIQVIQTEKILISVGRVPNTSNLGLENTGVQLNEHGYIITDPDYKADTCIHAAGDVIAGTPALVNVAEMEARFVIRKLWSQQPKPLKIHNMPTIMFFKPEVAAVGMNERQARQKGIPYRLVFYSNSLLPRSIAMRATSGFIKILISDDASERIIGMRAVGPQASSLIMNIAYLMVTGHSVDDYLNTIHPHPCMPESILEALRVLKGTSLCKPEVFPNQCYTKRWTPESTEDDWHLRCNVI
jgi:dihydrolipoamide dehydrogenase